MSSTNRGAVRNASDYYVTPIPAIETFLRAWAQDEPMITYARNILDPCAGGTRSPQGEIVIPMSYPTALHEFEPLKGAQLSTLDIRPDSAAVRIGDYLTTELSGTIPNLIISNPPFALAAEFIRKALADVAPGGFVAMLLRLNFFGSAKRKPFMQSNPPMRAYVHSERMGFNGHRTDLPLKERNGTDSIEYMHAVWQAGHKATETKLKVI